MMVGVPLHGTASQEPTREPRRRRNYSVDDAERVTRGLHKLRSEPDEKHRKTLGSIYRNAENI